VGVTKSLVNLGRAKCHANLDILSLVSSVCVLGDLTISEVDVLGPDRLHWPAVVTGAPAHDLHAPVVDLEIQKGTEAE